MCWSRIADCKSSRSIRAGRQSERACTDSASSASSTVAAILTYEERRIDRSQADTIVAVDGEKATTKDSFLALIERHRPGEQASITVLRGGQLVDVLVTLNAAESNRVVDAASHP